ncbi:MAG: hypothetical protein O8C59_04025, partial [Candidatus Methanoperedens sp.]|nr:hypothetical protein [Candidatus Methanoperedens sp.]
FRLAYAKKLGDNLQKNIYEAMELLSIGFLSWQDNALTKNEPDLREVQENTLKLLYRLLFIFFAESRKLLDIDNPEYKKLSLESIKYDIANKKDSGERILGKLTPLLKRIEATDGLIDAIVYKLYRLTEDEIKIVQGSISGGNDAKETGISE